MNPKEIKPYWLIYAPAIGWVKRLGNKPELTDFVVLEQNHRRFFPLNEEAVDDLLSYLKGRRIYSYLEETIDFVSAETGKVVAQYVPLSPVYRSALEFDLRNHGKKQKTL